MRAKKIVKTAVHLCALILARSRAKNVLPHPCSDRCMTGGVKQMMCTKQPNLPRSTPDAPEPRGQVSASIDEQRDMPSWVKEYACGLGKGNTGRCCGTVGSGSAVCERFKVPRRRNPHFLSIEKNHTVPALKRLAFRESDRRRRTRWIAGCRRSNDFLRSLVWIVPFTPVCLPAFLPFPYPLAAATKEIYVVSIGAFAGRGFSDLVRELFEQHGVILLGISEDRRVVLHPGAGYIITEVQTVSRDCFELRLSRSYVVQSPPR